MWWILLGLALAAEPAAEALDAVVLVVTGSSTCSGAIVDARGRVATAYHCVAPGGRPMVRTRDGKAAVGRVVGVDRPRDLAVIDVPELAGRPAVTLADAPPEPGETVYALGHPYGVSAPMGFLEGTLRWSLTRGVVSALGPQSVQFSAPINPGNSGGPVVDDQGRLIAVVSRRTGGSEGLGFGGRVEHLQALLDEADSGVGAIGGTWGVVPLVTAWDGQGGIVSAGGRVDVAIRDRVVLGGTLRWGLSPRWSAVRFDEVQFAGPAARLGLRQRVGRGRLALKLDAWGELTLLPGMVSEIGGGRVEVFPTSAWTGLVGGQIAMGGGAFDMGCSPVGDGCAASLVLQWPGVVGVF